MSEYIEAVNIALKKFKVKLQGEVTEAKAASSGHVYFTIKDKETGAVLECVIWKYNYKICGVEMEAGLEVILSGYGEVYAPRGKFTFIADVVELKGEGALKKAYDKLKQKLEQEGIFALERKKPLPEFAQKIGVITSRQGAVIHDLLSNLGKFGFKVKMVDSRVEGQEAIEDILQAINLFSKTEIDVLVIIRGGGSLESLQPFNNETIVRAILDFSCPIISAIGHDKDVPLLSLAADISCSTPTAAANLLNKSWEMAPLTLQKLERLIFEKFSRELLIKEGQVFNSYVIFEIFGKAIFINQKKIWQFFNQLAGSFGSILGYYQNIETKISQDVVSLKREILNKKKTLDDFSVEILTNFQRCFKDILQKMDFIQKTIEANSPAKNLVLGYCLARKNGVLLRSVKDIEKEENFDLQMKDGIINSKVNDIHDLRN